MEAESLASSVYGKQVLAQAARMMEWPGYHGRNWTLQRLDESGPRAQDRAPDDPMAEHVAMVDVVGYLTVGDMVLQETAALILQQRGVAFQDPPGPWVALMGYSDGLDERSLLRPAARYLDLLLINARHRIAAHWRQGHTLNFGWQPDGALQVLMVDFHGQEEARALLERVNAGLQVPTRTLDLYELREWIFAFGPTLGAEARADVRKALALSGYETYPVAVILDDVLKLFGLRGSRSRGHHRLRLIVPPRRSRRARR